MTLTIIPTITFDICWFGLAIFSRVNPG